ncbi:ATP-binding protein [Mycobacterium paragordonae]|uniref:ATP-binding protein n=1 Tax=Mycobacterium paragordonae TaxID=1389713 RepID=UPI00140B3F82|nr:ATP-binding protein [Mycobacterium paragordonae]
MIDQEILVEEAVFRVGEVVGVFGRTIKIRVDKTKNGSHLLYRGQLLRNVSVGGYVKISKGFSDLIGKVDDEEITPELPDDAYRSQRDRLDRVLTVSLVGFVVKEQFRRGVRELPLVGNECFLLSEAEFDRIHSFVSERDTPITIGKLAMEKEQIVRVGVNSLFASHIGIFGNTGSGKSYTLAKLYHELFKLYGEQSAFRQRARVLVIDFNGEYVNAEGAEADDRCGSIITGSDLKTEYRLSTRNDSGDRLPLRKEALEDPTIWTVLLDATEKTQAPFLIRALRSDYWERRLSDADSLTEAIASIVHAAILSSDATLEKGLIVQFLEEVQGCFGDGAPTELHSYVEDIRTRLHYHNSSRVYYYDAPDGTTVWASDEASVRRHTFDRFALMIVDPDMIQSIDRIRFKIVLQYYSDVFKGFANRDHLGPLIKRLETRMPQIKRVLEVSEDPILASPLTVISLRGVNLDMRKVIPLLICRQLYDAKKSQPGSNDYLNIVVDEAHNILSSVSARESEAWKDYRLETFEEIIKEGRKFGVFLTIASQRPHDISETIISQLHNYFLHRLVNNLDILAVERSVSYLDRVSFESLPILPTGSCVLSGVSTQVPLVIDIDPLEERYEPNNRTMTLADGWYGDADDSEEFDF